MLIQRRAFASPNLAVLFMVSLAAAACSGTIEGAGSHDPATDPSDKHGRDPVDPDQAQDPDTPSACATDEGGASPPRIWRLSPVQYENATGGLLDGDAGTTTNPFEGTESGKRFKNQSEGLGVPEQAADALVRSGQSVAAKWAGEIKARFPCADALGDSCVRQIIESEGGKAFRRPVSSEEMARYANLVTDNRTELGGELALQLGLEALLMSPHFVFRWEVGGGMPDAHGRLDLTPHELASALAFTVTDAPPDAELLAAATEGRLATREQVRAQVLRLIADPGDNNAALRLMQEYLQYPDAPEVFKDPGRAPFHDAEALVQSADLLMRDVLAGRTSFLRELLTTSTGFVSDATAASFGVPRPGTRDGAFARVQLPADQRGGFLTHPGFLVTFSQTEATDPVRRGKFVAQSLLCVDLPDLAPPNVPPLPDLGPNATLRELLAEHTTSESSCYACHRFMDPIGLGLEAYDDLGRFRTEEKGRPVDSTGSLFETGDQDGPFDGGIELGERLARSSVVSSCFARHAFQYWLGRNDDQPHDDCAVSRAVSAYDAADGDVVEMFVSLLTSDPFLYRKQ